LLGALAHRGLLDPGEPPERRVTEARVMAYLDQLFNNGNAGHTVCGRLSELRGALRILAPAPDFGWLLRPGGADMGGRLDMTPRRWRRCRLHRRMTARHQRPLTGEWNRLSAAASAETEGKHRELDTVWRKLHGLIEAIADGLRALGLRGRLDELDSRKEQLEREIVPLSAQRTAPAFILPRRRLPRSHRPAAGGPRRGGWPRGAGGGAGAGGAY
jgi:hypothetical protein